MTHRRQLDIAVGRIAETHHINSEQQPAPSGRFRRFSPAPGFQVGAGLAVMSATGFPCYARLRCECGRVLRRRYRTTSCRGSAAMISALPRKDWMVPVAHVRFPISVVSGVPNFGRSLPQMTTLNIWRGYDRSKLRNVGCPFVPAAYRVDATTPQTVAFSPMCSGAWAAVSMFAATVGVAT